MEKFESERLYLRELAEADVTEEYLNWFRDDRVTGFLQAKNLTRQEVVDYMNYGRNSKTYYMYAICDKLNNKHIGNLKIGPIDLRHNVSDLVTVIGDTSYWGKGLATEIIQVGNRLAFEKYDIRKLTGGMYEGNTSSIKAYTKAGWITEGRLIGHYLCDDGRVMDRVQVSCFNPKYFYQDESSDWKAKV